MTEPSARHDLFRYVTAELAGAVVPLALLGP